MELLKNNSLRPAWIEIDLKQLQRNFEIINQDKPANLQILSVVKAQAYGHGAYEVAKVALANEVNMLGVATIDEALELRTKGIAAPIMLFGEKRSISRSRKVRAPTEIATALLRSRTTTSGGRIMLPHPEPARAWNQTGCPFRNPAPEWPPPFCVLRGSCNAFAHLGALSASAR